ncbi:oligopeptidase A [Citrobacter koseri]|uniref:Oligopeptidase A n=1 Tax=Citrobacter koseri TaxID=545 RepID=A0A3S4JQX6_CITKO|nr:oligopeptidase A [Citrobacter koseri]
MLGRIFSPVSHLNSVKNSPELREAYEQTLPLLSEYSTWVGQHEGLYNAYRDLRDGDHYATLNLAQKKRLITRCAILSFPVLVCRRKNSSAMVKSPLACPSWVTSTATTWLDATMGWTKLVTDDAELAGMPESALAAAKAQAEAKEQEGWLLTLDIPSYLPVDDLLRQPGIA